MSASLHWRFEASDVVARLRRVSDELDSAITAKGASEQTRFAARVVVEELVLNAFEHGGAGRVTLEAAACDDPVRLVIEDDGALFDPTTRAHALEAGDRDSDSPRGRGLTLLHAAVRHVDHAVLHGRNRVTVLLSLR